MYVIFSQDLVNLVNSSIRNQKDKRLGTDEVLISTFVNHTNAKMVITLKNYCKD